MDTKAVGIGIIILIIGFLGGYFLSNARSSGDVQSLIKNDVSLTQSKEKMYESEAQTCLQLAQNAYLRDFINLCKKDQPSPSCDSTDFNGASEYGVYQLGANPSGDFALLYKTYESDMNLCTGNPDQGN